MYYIYIKEINNPLRNQTMNLENIINENIKRFGTKNLSESDLKRIEEQASAMSVLDKLARAEMKTNLSKREFFDYVPRENSLTITPSSRENAFGMKADGGWPFLEVIMYWDTEANKFKGIPKYDSFATKKNMKANLAKVGIDAKQLATDMKIDIAKRARKNEGETLNINEQQADFNKVIQKAKNDLKAKFGKTFIGQHGNKRMKKDGSPRRRAGLAGSGNFKIHDLQFFNNHSQSGKAPRIFFRVQGEFGPLFDVNTGTFRKQKEYDSIRIYLNKYYPKTLAKLAAYAKSTKADAYQSEKNQSGIK